MLDQEYLKIIPLGGLGEIGKNMTVFEYKDTIIIIDSGLAFPSDDMFGIDLVIPDITYLQRNKNKIKAIILTHGHEDHIGSVPYVIREFNVPIYGTKLTLGILKNKLKEHKLLSIAKLMILNPDETIKMGEFEIEFIKSNHSIADSVMIAVHTPVGVILHTSDFKIDTTPINDKMTNLTRIGELGKKGVLLLLSDSTNAERPGYSISEKFVGKKFDEIFESNKNKRIFVATFASNIHRVQQVINSAVKFKRKVAVSGRSMSGILSAAMELGYMNIPDNTLIDIDDICRYSKESLTIITTGSQGEPMSALTRMAMAEHKKVVVEYGDLVIISATPIPGNEKAVSNVINELFKKGADVIYDAISDIHVSGHACQEELKTILSLANPKFFMPVHGEYRHLVRHKEIAKYVGIPESSIFIMKIGDVLTLTPECAKILPPVPSGNVFVDGLGVGDVGNVVLRDRKLLAEEGVLVIALTLNSSNASLVAGPDIISRGFIYVRESEALIDQIKEIVFDLIRVFEDTKLSDWNVLKNEIRSVLSDFLFSKTKRRPMIMPVVMQVCE